MKLRGRHYDFARHVVENNNPMAAYKKFYKCKNNNVASAGSTKLVKRPEIQELIVTMQRDKEAMIKQARSEELEKMKDQIISEIELDKFHTDVLRNDISVEEIIVMREFTPAHKDGKGNDIPGRWISAIKKIQRAPNLREKQISADQLFKRKGSFAAVKVKAEVDLSDNRETTRLIKLSDGSTLPMPQ